MSETEDKKRKAILVRIRAMMARTVANGYTEAEAQAAAETVDRLVAEYEIDLTETTVADQEIVKLEIKLKHHPVRFTARRLSEFCDCKYWFDDDTGMIVFLGLEIDTEIAEYLFLMFQRAIDRETAQFSMFNADFALAGPDGRKQMIHSFSVGMATRLGDRLLELKGKRDFSQRASGFDLVLAKKPLVEAAFGTLGITLHPGRAERSIRHAGAYNAGRTAAEGVAINQGIAGGRGRGAGEDPVMHPWLKDSGLDPDCDFVAGYLDQLLADQMRDPMGLQEIAEDISAMAAEHLPECVLCQQFGERATITSMKE